MSSISQLEQEKAQLERELTDLNIEYTKLQQKILAKKAELRSKSYQITECLASVKPNKYSNCQSCDKLCKKKVLDVNEDDFRRKLCQECFDAVYYYR